MVKLAGEKAQCFSSTGIFYASASMRASSRKKRTLKRKADERSSVICLCSPCLSQSGNQALKNTGFILAKYGFHLIAHFICFS